MNAILNLERERLFSLTKKYHIYLIVLFGTVAKGISRENSDIDLGVELKRPIRDEQESELLVDFVNLFKTDSLDLVILNYASPLLLFQAAKNGIPIFEKNRGDFMRFKLRAFKKYWETRKFRDMRNTYLNKLVSRV